MTLATQTFHIKLLALLCVACLLVPGNMANAFFGDTERSLNNEYAASSLGIALSPDGSGDYREVTITANEAEDVEYRLSFSVSGDPFCDDLEVRIKRNDADLYNAPIAPYVSAPSLLATNGIDEWIFNYDVAPGSTGGSCTVTSTFEANQVGYNHGEAFFDTETYQYTLTGADFGLTPPAPGPATPAGIFINEVLANPVGDESTDERIELFNNSGVSVDLTGWSIKDTAAHTTNLPAVSIVDGGFLVVNANNLNNSSDTLTLFDNTTGIRDTFTYTDADDTNEGKTASRCPDGDAVTEPTDATLGAANSCPSVLTRSFMFAPQVVGTLPPPLETESIEEPAAPTEPEEPTVPETQTEPDESNADQV